MRMEQKRQKKNKNKNSKRPSTLLVEVWERERQWIMYEWDSQRWSCRLLWKPNWRRKKKNFDEREWNNLNKLFFYLFLLILNKTKRIPIHTKIKIICFFVFVESKNNQFVPFFLTRRSFWKRYFDTIIHIILFIIIMTKYLLCLLFVLCAYSAARIYSCIHFSIHHRMQSRWDSLCRS